MSNAELVELIGGGSAGTPAGGVITVQGISGGVPITAGDPVNTTVNVTIANGAATSGSSGSLDIRRLSGIILPSGWDTSQSITLLASVDNSNFYATQDESGTLYSITVAAAPVFVVVTYKFLACSYLKVQASGNVVGDQVVTLIFS